MTEFYSEEILIYDANKNDGKIRKLFKNTERVIVRMTKFSK